MENSNSDRNDLTSIFGEVISQYTRADALADGQLVDVSTTAREAGYKYHTVFTRALWDVVERIPKRAAWQDVEGRTWDVLYMGADAIRRSRGGLTRISYQLILLREGTRQKLVTLIVDLGPGDNGEPVFTIGFPEDF